jgi:hypothetical protein
MLRTTSVPCALIAALALTPIRAAADEEAVPAFNGLSRPNGRQVLRAGDHWLVITPDSTGQRAMLATAGASAPLALAGWETRLFLAPDDRGLFRVNGSCPVPPSLVLDPTGQVHAAWGSGDAVWYARGPAIGTDLVQRVRERRSWTGTDGQEPKAVLANAVLGDLSVTDKGEVWLAAVKRGPGTSTTLCLGRHAGQWTFEDLITDIGFHPPVMQVMPDGSAHLAWSDTRGRVLYLHHRRGTKAEPRVLCAGGYYPNGRHPMLISTGRQLLIVYETWYAEIEYALEEDGKWITNQRLTWPDRRFNTDVLHSPQLTRDRHGVVWLFFADSTRQFTYFTRWLGTRWSDIYDCRGIHYRSPRYERNHLAADWFAVERQPPTTATDIGIVLASQLAPDRNEFHRVAVPVPSATAGASALFFDLLETAGLDNVELSLNEARKEPANPLLRPGKPGAFDQDRVLNHGTVIFDEDTNKFRMWYGAAHRQKGVSWFKWMSTGYAESKDGLTWEKVPTGAADTEKETDQNHLPMLPWPCALFKDRNDVPERRYKVVQFDRHQHQEMASLRGEYDMASAVVPGRLHQSADGLHWSSVPITMAFPGGKPWEFVVQSFFIDPREPDPARRWKVYGYATLTARRRAGCFGYSADGKKWVAYPSNPILDPTVSEVPMVPAGPQSQIHDTVVFPYGGYYLALFHAQHDHQFLDVELAVSRDGEHFAHVKPGHKVIPLGEKGAWDYEQILQTPPVIAADKLWLFYGGQAPSAENVAKNNLSTEALQGSAGLATLRIDGFTRLGLKPGKSSGAVTTVPLAIRNTTPLRLVVNAACTPEATLTAEVLDADSGQPVSGFTRHACEAVASDSVRSTVRWKGNDRLPLAGRKQLVLRFWLTGKEFGPKLYGFHFAPADTGKP